MTDTTVSTTVETSVEAPADDTLSTATPDEGDVPDGSAASDDPAGTPADEDAAGPDSEPDADQADPDADGVSTDMPPAGPPSDTPSGATALAAARQTFDLEALRGQDAESALRALGLTALADELVGMREKGIDLRVEKYAALVTPATGAHLRALLGHRDPAVVASTEAVLEVLGARGPAFAADPKAKPVTVDSGRVVQLGMAPEEVGPVWAALSTAERKARQHEYDEWTAARAGS